MDIHTHSFFFFFANKSVLTRQHGPHWLKEPPCLVKWAWRWPGLPRGDVEMEGAGAGGLHRTAWPRDALVPFSSCYGSLSLAPPPPQPFTPSRLHFFGNIYLAPARIQRHSQSLGTQGCGGVHGDRLRNRWRQSGNRSSVLDRPWQERVWPTGHSRETSWRRGPLGEASVMTRTSPEAEDTQAVSQDSSVLFMRHLLWDRRCFSHLGYSSQPARHRLLAWWSWQSVGKQRVMSKRSISLRGATWGYCVFKGPNTMPGT